MEVEMLRSNDVTKDALIVVTGITPEGYKKPQDQIRFGTPTDAMKAGADIIIAGRSIMNPPDGTTRVESVQQIVSEIEAVRYKPKGKEQKQ